MGRYRRYWAEFALIGATMGIGLLGFWDVYLGPSADPKPHHHLHVATTYSWMALLAAQLVLLAQGRGAQHRNWGLAVLALGPVLVASAALLTNHSAHRAITTGQPDMLLVPNIVGTVGLAVVLICAFAMRRRRKLHGAFLMSTLIYFLGPALFFALIAFAPPFKIEGPETFYRFQQAGMTGLAINAVLCVLMFLRDRRNNWPFLLALATFPVAQAIAASVAAMDLTDALTQAVAAPDRLATFAVAWALVSALLAAVLLPGRTSRTGRVSNNESGPIQSEPVA